SKNVSSKVGPLAGNAMARKKDRDYLSTFTLFSTAVSPGTGNPISHGHINAGVSRIGSNASEPGTSPIHVILRGEQVYDLQSEVLAPVGTYEMSTGFTAETYKKGLKGEVGGARIWEDNLI